ncbi:hypothetical protein [Microbacterium sp. 22242]|uniref:hypothetical protein n=1 Tax=Microbacterium sp. 22242 TaxID=3453896 RepID=UPI003F8660AF
MRKLRSAAAAATVVTTAAAIALLTAAPASAAAQTFRQHDSFDPTGSTFSCSTGDLTVTGGMVYESFEGVMDAQGMSHITGTIVPRGVTLTDEAGNTYYLSGSSWFGATGADEDSMTVVATNTDHFVIRMASGGVYATVSVVEHFSPNGDYFLKDTGVCEAPEG